MKTTCTINGEACVVEGSQAAVDQYFKDLSEPYQRRRDTSGGEGISINGVEHVRLSRFVTNDDDPGEGLDLPSTRPRVTEEFNITNRERSNEPTYDAGAAFNYAGGGFDDFGQGIIDNSIGPDEGLDIPSTRPIPEGSPPKQTTANAGRFDDDDPGEGLDLPSTRPPLTA